MPLPKCPPHVLWCCQPGINKGHSWGMHIRPQPTLFLHSGPCQEMAANGKVQVPGYKVTGKLVVKNLSQGGRTTCETTCVNLYSRPSAQTLSTCSTVMGFTYKTHV